jgi:hypothetical protein
MSYIREHDNISFSWILNESNYGALEKDHRLEEINTKLKASMIKNVTNRKVADHYMDVLQLGIKSKDKDNKVNLIWNMDVGSQKNPTFFSSGAGIEPLNKSTYELTVKIIKAEGMNDQIFYKKLLEFLSLGEIDKILLHEIKHMLDGVDQLFTKDSYHHVTDLNDKVLFSKYMSQNKEIDAFLISTISDLKKIKKDNPTISLDVALRNSAAYHQFEKYTAHNKLNKYKQKIVYFWSQYNP